MNKVSIVLLVALLALSVLGENPPPAVAEKTEKKVPEKVEKKDFELKGFVSQ